MKAKLNLLILLVLSMVLFSCGNKIPTGDIDITGNPYRVTKITEFSTGICTYHIKTGVDYTNYADNLIIVDSIGKFTIGDTVYISLNKN